MRRSDYDRTEQNLFPTEKAEHWQPIRPEGPYGPIPGAAKPPAPPFYRTPELWKNQPPAAIRREAGKGTRVFAFFLAAILLLSGTALFLWPEEVELPFSAGWDSWEEWDYAGENWLRDLENTSIRRAPNGDGTVLNLSQAEGAARPPEPPLPV